jgi:hypothetical protein
MPTARVVETLFKKDPWRQPPYALLLFCHKFLFYKFCGTIVLATNRKKLRFGKVNVGCSFNHPVVYSDIAK